VAFDAAAAVPVISELCMMTVAFAAAAAAAAAAATNNKAAASEEAARDGEVQGCEPPEGLRGMSPTSRNGKHSLAGATMGWHRH